MDVQGNVIPKRQMALVVDAVNFHYSVLQGFASDTEAFLAGVSHVFRSTRTCYYDVIAVMESRAGSHNNGPEFIAAGRSKTPRSYANEGQRETVKY